MIGSIRRFFAAAPHKERLPEDEVRRLYPAYRWRVLEATFLGYATYYLVRNNVAVVSKDVENALGYTDGMIGNLLTVTALSYGLGKFVMGAVSDRSNARVFMAFGLLLTALCNFAFGAIGNYHIHLLLWTLNGFFQGMGWPPCGRCMGHWYSERERGLTFSIWNTSHNVGGGIAGYIAAWGAAQYGGWQYAFIIPGVLALIGSVYLFLRLVDTPQSVGLPPIEEYNNDHVPDTGTASERERELSYKELFIDYVLFNKVVWLLAFANFFAYVSRYVMIDWGPKYLREVKEASLQSGGLAHLVLEFGGIPSTILLGWLSDKIGGRRGMVAVLCMFPIIGAFVTMMLSPSGHIGLDMAMLAIIGLFIYPVINLIVIIALDLTSKKAIGAAAGFIGLFGYLGKAAQAQGFGRVLDYYKSTAGLETAWRMVFYGTLACSFLAIVCLAFTWNFRTRSAAKSAKPEDQPELAEV